MAAFLRLLCAACWLLYGTAALGATCEAALPLDQAVRSFQGSGADAGGTRTVAIPDSIAQALRKERVRISYEIDISACATAPAAALWLFRVGAPYRITSDGHPLALLNARALLRPGLLASGLALELDAVHNGRVPALFALPAGATRVTVELQTLAYFPSGIARGLLGPAHALLAVQAEASEAVVAYIDAASAVLLVVSLMAMLLWLSRRGERAMLWLAVACGLWGLRGLTYFGHKVYVEPLAFEQYNSLNVLLTSGALSVAVLHLLGGISRRERLTLLWATGVCAALYLAALWAGQSSLAVRALCLLTSFCMIGWLMWRVWCARAQRAHWHSVALFGGLLALHGCGVHDILLLTGRLAPDNPSYIFWGFFVLLAGVTAMSGQYVVQTLNRAERANDELEQHVIRKSAELEHSYERLRASEAARTRAEERARISREMHDGIGSHLLATLRGVERGTLDAPHVAHALQDGLDELRLIINASDHEHGLFVSAQTWRHRWAPRLEAAGVELRWEIDAQLEQLVLDAHQVLQWLRVLQEAVTNALKHARPQSVSVQWLVQGSALSLRVSDDGSGLAPEAADAPGRGMNNMRHRARELGATIHWSPGAQGRGTCVEMTGPVHRALA